MIPSWTSSNIFMSSASAARLVSSSTCHRLISAAACCLSWSSRCCAMARSASRLATASLASLSCWDRLDASASSLSIWSFSLDSASPWSLETLSSCTSASLLVSSSLLLKDATSACKSRSLHLQDSRSLRMPSFSSDLAAFSRSISFFWTSASDLNFESSASTAASRCHCCSPCCLSCFLSSSNSARSLRNSSCLVDSMLARSSAVANFTFKDEASSSAAFRACCASCRVACSLTTAASCASASFFTRSDSCCDFSTLARKLSSST
mmetsp:Transcript_98747/g.235336  ORF Transcript_98747/g.235336 Transcript_98747/m.235336 type:complete len:266 (-) Transcript_98747:1581-2378(-)